MLESIVVFVAGLLLLLFGATGVINSALNIASKIRISPLIVGITAVAIGTSLPEITVSIFGGISQATQLALGNIIGSNIANIGLLFGILILFNRIHVGRYKTQNNVTTYFFLSLIIFLILYTNNLNSILGFILILSGIAILWLQIRQGLKGALVEDKKLMRQTKKSHKNSFVLSLTFIVSIIALIIGGKLLVSYGVVLANIFNISQAIIGVTAVAVGTSLPELAIIIVGLFKGENKLIVGTILGSNMFNILFGAGILGLYKVDGFNSPITLIFFLFLSLLFSGILYRFRGKNIPRCFGLLFLLLYGSYLFLILT
ncbi:MAG: calcium/sodium antiporter [bacterium]